MMDTATRRTWLGLGLLGAVWVVACWPWLTGRAVIGWDNLDYAYPLLRYYATSFAGGELPTWNPYNFAGSSVLGEPQSMLFSPHAVAALLLGERYSIRLNDLLTLAFPLIGAAALYAYARREAGGGHLWPLLGAIVFMLGGSATGRLQHVPQIVAFALFPVLLLLVQEICRRPRAVPALALAVVAATLLLGMTQVTVLSVYLLAPLGLLHLVRSPSPGRAMLLLAAAGAAAAVMALPVIATVIENVANSNRSLAENLGDGLGAAVFVNSLRGFSILGLGMDGLFGFRDWPAAPFWTPTDPSQDYLFVGVAGVIGIVAKLLLLQRRDTHGMLLVLLFTFAFLFSLGGATPVFRWAVDYVPGFAPSRRPADGSYFMLAFAALMVAHAGTTLGARLPPATMARRLWQAAVLGLLLALLAWQGAALLAFAEESGHAAAVRASALAAAAKLVIALALIAMWRRLARPAPRRAIGLVILALATADLLQAGRFSAFVAVPDAMLELAPLVRARGDWRQLDQPTAAMLRFLEGEGAIGPDATHRLEVLGGPLATSTPLIFRALNTQGYSPLRVRPYASIFGAQITTLVGRELTEAAPGYDSPAFRALGLRWVLVHVPQASAVPVLLPGWRSVGQLRAELAGADWATLRATFANYEVWELANPGPRLSLSRQGDGAPVEGSCRFVHKGTRSVGISCEAREPSQLMFNDAAMPGWRACVGGAAAPIGIAHGAFRVVEVPAGTSIVTMAYEGVPWFRGGSCPAR